MPDLQEDLNRARERLASYLEDGGSDKLREAEEYLGYAHATPANVDQLQREFPFFEEWKKVIKPKEKEVEAAYRKFRKEHHPAVQLADLEHRLLYAEFASRHGVPHLTVSRMASGEYKSERTPWTEEIENLRALLEDARQEVDRGSAKKGPEYSFRLAIAEELYPDLTVEVKLTRKPSDHEWKAVESTFNAWGSAGAPDDVDDLSAVANMILSRDEKKRVVSAFCEVGNLEAIEPLFRALDGLNRREFPGLIKTVAVK